MSRKLLPSIGFQVSRGMISTKRSERSDFISRTQPFGSSTQPRFAIGFGTMKIAVLSSGSTAYLEQVMTWPSYLIHNAER